MTFGGSDSGTHFGLAAALILELGSAIGGADIQAQLDPLRLKFRDMVRLSVTLIARRGSISCDPDF